MGNNLKHSSETDTSSIPEPKRLRTDNNAPAERTMVRFVPQQTDTSGMGVERVPAAEITEAAPTASVAPMEWGLVATTSTYKGMLTKVENTYEEDKKSLINAEVEAITAEAKAAATAKADAEAAKVKAAAAKVEAAKTAVEVLIKEYNPQVWANEDDKWLPLSGDFKIGAELGSGRSGVVCKAWHDGKPVALKLCPVYSKFDIIDEMHNEVEIYKHLESLQGDCIPKLLNQGLLAINGLVYVAIVLELIEDALEFHEYDEVDRTEKCPRKARNDAIHALKRIHKLGVVQKDPRMFNVLFEATNDGLKPKIIDFAFAKVDASKEEIKEDCTGAFEIIYSANLNCRQEPTTKSKIVKVYQLGDDIDIVCQTKGEYLMGTSIWDYTPDGCYVLDYYLRTGFGGYFKPLCFNFTMTGSDFGMHSSMEDIDDGGAASENLDSDEDDAESTENNGKTDKEEGELSSDEEDSESDDIVSSAEDSLTSGGSALTGVSVAMAGVVAAASYALSLF
ncbi:hypothetical protein GGI07_002620 [Coemansia sp. Benny D115]|nr:hypothetical protein GGI07_002620 [Coemansia sp. Benny D115]